MYTTTMAAPTNATDAAFRLWGKFVADQLSAAGWVKVWDNGTDWTTVAAPGAINTYVVAEVWRTNDGRTNFFVKLEYGTGTVTNIPSIRWTTGWAHDGSGNLSVNTVGPIVHQTGAVSTTAAVCHFTGDTDRFGLIIPDFGSIGINLFFERCHPDDGDDMMVVGRGGSGTYRVQVLPPSGGIPSPQTTNIAVLAATAASDNTYGSNTGISQLSHFKGPRVKPGKQLILSSTGSFSAGSSINAVVNGASRPYQHIGYTSGSSTYFAGNINNWGWILAE